MFHHNLPAPDLIKTSFLHRITSTSFPRTQEFISGFHALAWKSIPESVNGNTYIPTQERGNEVP